MKVAIEKQRWRALCIAGAAWLLAFVAARAALEKMSLDSPVKILAAVLPVVPAAIFLWYFVDYLRSLDELQRRVHLEALAIAYPLATLFLWTLGLLELAIELPSEDWSYRHIWTFLPMFYFIGLAIAWRRYR